MSTMDGMKWSRKGLKVWQTWTSDWRGHKIILKNRFSLLIFGTGEEVYVDDRLVFLNKAVLNLSPLDVIFQVTLPEPGSITARLRGGMIWPTGRPGLKLFFNEELVAGDIKKRFKRWWEICLLCGLMSLLLAAPIAAMEWARVRQVQQRAEFEWVSSDEAVLRPPLCDQAGTLQFRFKRDLIHRERVSEFSVEDASGKKLQGLDEATKYLTWAGLIRTHTLTIIDYNYDGCKDLAIYSPGDDPSRNAYSVHVWLLNPESRRFEYHPGLSAIPSAYPKRNQKKMVWGWNNSLDRSSLRVVYYSWRSDGQLELKRRLHQEIQESGTRVLHIRKVFDVSNGKDETLICDAEFSRAKTQFKTGNPESCLANDFWLSQ